MGARVVFRPLVGVVLFSSRGSQKKTVARAGFPLRQAMPCLGSEVNGFARWAHMLARFFGGRGSPPKRYGILRTILCLPIWR